jgi:hypothetical protein
MSGPACVRKSAVEGLPAHFVAGRAERLMVHARDATGCQTQGGDAVQVLVDSAAEGRQDLPVQARMPWTTPPLTSPNLFLEVLEHPI